MVAVEQVMVGSLLILIVLVAAWLLVVYNRMMNLMSVMMEQRRSIEKHCRIRREYREESENKVEGDVKGEVEVELEDPKGKTIAKGDGHLEMKQMEKKLKELDSRIANLQRRREKTVAEFQHFCRSSWVKPALLIMGVKNPEKSLQETEVIASEKK
ncbi:hypothetical protein SAMN05192546_107160 [Tindallia californiensis]|uniref:Uncharacterized protein n=1 Tax=Tindallia californiensis TaxID=159292 RepID=A0A1H3PX65_9FIRM|nr:hypothetical protein SAMN05192546_107160 [Tindallia californiensis]